MKIFFDTNVYVAEAILGEAAERMVQATHNAAWRVYYCQTILDELDSVLTQRLGFSRRFARLTQGRVVRRGVVVVPGASRHAVAADSGDTPILQAAMGAGTDYLVTNDAHLLALDPYEGMRIISMTEYHQLLIQWGLLEPPAGG